MESEYGNNPDFSYSSNSSNSREEKQPDQAQTAGLRPELVPMRRPDDTKVRPAEHRARRMPVKPEEVPVQEMSQQLYDQNRQKDVDSKNLRFVISIEGEFKRVWDSINTVFMILTCVYIPVRLSFLYDVHLNVEASVFEWSATGFFACDLILNFFTPQHNGTEYEYTFFKRSKVYLKAWFWVDLVSVFPLEEAITAFSSFSYRGNIKFYSQMLKVAKGLRLLRILRTLNLKNTREDNYFFAVIKSALGDTLIFDFLPSICSLLLSTHIAACSWYAVGYFNYSHDCWISLSNLHDKPLFDLYIYSAYFVLQTFTTVGYGDVPSVLNSERYMRIVFMITGVVEYSIFTGKITDYQTKKVDAAEVSHFKVDVLERIEANYQVPSETMIKVRERLFNQEEEPVADGNLDFSRLSDKERQLFNYAKFLNELKGIPDIKQLKEIALVEAFGSSLRKRKFGEGQVIYSRGEPASSLYFLEKGTVGVMSVLFENLPHHHVTKGCFGEYELFTGEPRHFTTAAMTECTVYCLPVEAFKQIYLQTHNKQVAKLRANLEAFAIKRHQMYIEGYKEMLKIEMKLLKQKFDQRKHSGIFTVFSNKARSVLQQLANISSKLTSRGKNKPEIGNQTVTRNLAQTSSHQQHLSESNANSQPGNITAQRTHQLELMAYEFRTPPQTPKKPKKSEAYLTEGMNHNTMAEVATAHSSAKKNTDMDVSEDDNRKSTEPPPRNAATLQHVPVAGSRANPNPRVITRNPKDTSPRKSVKTRQKTKSIAATINNFS